MCSKNHNFRHKLPFRCVSLLSLPSSHPYAIRHPVILAFLSQCPPKVIIFTTHPLPFMSAEQRVPVSLWYQLLLKEHLHPKSSWHNNLLKLLLK